MRTRRILRWKFAAVDVVVRVGDVRGLAR